MLLLIISAEYNSLTSPMPPEINLNRTLIAKALEYRFKNGMAISNPSYYFLEKYVRTLKTPENTSFYSSSNIIVYKYTNNAKLAVHVKYTDSNFWDILNFNFTEGRAYSKNDVDNVNFVAVISEKIKKEYFGDQQAVGKAIRLDDVTYRIAGVVKDVNKGRMSYADVWVPLTTGKYDIKDPEYGGFDAMILARDKSDFEKIQNEFYGRLKYVSTIKGKDLRRVICPLRTNVGWLEGGKILGVRVFKQGDALLEEENWLSFENTILIFMIFLILMPVINLIYINLTRISERASEISIRKSFGASSVTLVGQFITENLVLTLIGGLIGFIFAEVSVSLLNSNAFFESNLNIDFYVGLYGLFFIFAFGLLSGVYPAYKMSRLNPVEGMRGGI